MIKAREADFADLDQINSKIRQEIRKVEQQYYMFNMNETDIFWKILSDRSFDYWASFWSKNRIKLILS